MNQKYLLIYLFFWMGALALSITSIPVFAQSEPEPPRLSAEIMELPPYSEAHPKVQISSTTATGDRASGYAYAADLLSIDWPPPGMEPILWAPSSGYRKQPVEQDTSLVLVVATAQLSSDGNATVGTLSRSHRDPLKARTLDRAYRWSESAGFQWLPAPDEAQTRAYACSDDGSYVIGRILRHSTNPAREVRWHADGTVDTVPPIAGNTRCFLRGVSGSGTVAVGTSFPPRSDTIFSRRAFYWTPTEGSRPVPGLEAYGTSEANAVSADGRYIVGYAYDGPLSNLPDARAWRYSKAEGLEWLGTWIATDLNADGSVVVGSYRNAIAMLWYTDRGEVELRTLINEEGWWLPKITAINAAGNVLYGMGDSPITEDCAWRVEIID